jgi:hypothetical protein
MLDRMMQNFRARSDLLVGQYEDEDEVQHSISDTSDSEQDERIGKEKHVTPTKYVCWNFTGKQFVGTTHRLHK